MPTRDLVFVAALDITFVAVMGVLMLVRAPRQRAAPSPAAKRTGAPLAGAAAMLLLVALPLPWAGVSSDRHDLTNLEVALASSWVALGAIAFAVAALVLGATLRMPGGSLVVRNSRVALGVGWCLVALNSLVLTWGANRAAVGDGRMTTGPALWFCLIGGIVAIVAGGVATNVAAPATPAASAPLDAPPYVDEWGFRKTSAPDQTGDQW